MRSNLYECLKGWQCWGGLDLSKTQDMTALALAFPADGLMGLLPWFWMPEETAREKNHLAPYLEWAVGGHLTLTPGDVVDYGAVRADIVNILADYSPRQLLYDMTYAEQITQEIETKANVERLVFPQTITSFAGPTAEFERLVIGGFLRHPNHPILNWQAGNVSVKTDANNNKRPVKPPHDDPRKIDGIVASIMAVAGAVSGKGRQKSVYKRRGVLTA